MMNINRETIPKSIYLSLTNIYDTHKEKIKSSISIE